MKTTWLKIVFLSLLGFGLLFGCSTNKIQPDHTTPTDWKIVNARGIFSFSVPKDLQEQAIQGIDSYVGEYKSQSMNLSFDFGMWSNPLDDSSQPQFQQLVTEINNEPAKIVLYTAPQTQTEYNYFAGVHFPSEKNPTGKLTMSVRCKDSESQKTAVKIFYSIKFLQRNA